MGDNKRIAKNTLALFIRMCFIAVLGLVSSRYMLQYLGKIDFGIYNVVGGAVNLMAFFNIVLASATNRFLMTELGKGKNANLGKVFTSSIQIHASIGVFVILLGETIGFYYIHNFLNVPMDRVADAQTVYQISLFTCALCVLQVPYQGLLIAYENFTRYSVVQVAMMVGILVAAVIIQFFEEKRLVWFALFMALSQTLGLILYIIMGRRYVPSLQKGIDWQQIRSMLGFSGWIAFGAASAMGRNQGSNMVLNYFFGPVVNSAFSIAHQVNAQISRLSENVSKSFNPQIMMSYQKQMRERMISLICASSKYSFFMLYLVAFPFFAKTEYILTLWLGDYPEYTVTFCHIIMVNVLISSLSQGVHPAVQATGNIKWFQIVGSTVTLTTIPLSILFFIQGFPPYLLSISFLSSSIISVCLGYYMMNRILHFPVLLLFQGIYLKVLPVVVITFPFLWLLKDYMEDTIVGLILTVLISTLLITTSICMLGLTIQEKKTVLQFVQKKLYHHL